MRNVSKHAKNRRVPKMEAFQTNRYVHVKYILTVL
jgi:hypothetical protein